nr:glycosyltransferase family 4 protein [uncultured Shinella sp.]
MPKQVDHASNNVAGLHTTTGTESIGSTAAAGSDSDTLTVPSSDLADPLVALTAQLSAFREEAQRLRADAERDIRMVEARAERAVQDTVNLVRSSLSYQIGDAIVRHFRKPWRLPLLPIVLTRVIVRWKKGDHPKMRDAIATISRSITQRSASPEIGAPMSLADVLACNDMKLLRHTFWEAFHRKDVGTCSLVYKRLRGLNKAAPNDREQKYLEKIAGNLTPEVKLFEILETRKPPQLEMRPGSVCYFLHNSLPYASGGYATRARGVVQGLTAHGLAVDICTRPGFPLDQKKELTAGDVSATDVIDGITYHRILEPARNRFKQADYMTRAADAVEVVLRRLRPSIAMAASNYYTGLPVLIAARRLGIPFVYEVRGFWEVTRVSREPGFKFTMPYSVQEFMEAELCREADAVFTLTSAMKAELIRRDVPAAKITLLPNSCDPEVFAPLERSTSLLLKLGIPAGVPVIGYIGSFVQYEGLDDLALACGILKSRGVEFRLLIVGNENVVGSGLGPIAQSVIDRAKTGNFEDWVIMPGRVPHDEVPDYYSIIDVAAFPRKAQPVTEMVSPMKSLEAMSMSKTVVVSSVSALAEMVDHGRTGLIFTKGDMEDFADKLQAAAKDPDLRKTLGVNAREWIANNRTWTSAGQIAHSVLSSILPKSNSDPAVDV